MSLFGLPDKAYDANQLHILFIPIMTAYGLAFISILWGRMGFATNMPLVRNGHLVITVFLSSVPMILSLIPGIRQSFRSKDIDTQALNISHIRDHTEPSEIVVSDAPASVAWYGDRSSLWLPTSPQQMREIKLLTAQKGQPLSGILLTRQSSNKSLFKKILVSFFQRNSFKLLQTSFNLFFSKKAHFKESTFNKGIVFLSIF